jgi:hypothetical protein
MSSSDYNRIISTVNSVSSNFSFVPDLNNVIVIDTSNNRIGINNTNPEYSLDISGNVENKHLGIITPNLTICGGYVHSRLIPNKGNEYDLGNISKPWNSMHCVSGNFQNIDLSINNQTNNEFFFINNQPLIGFSNELIHIGYDFPLNVKGNTMDVDSIRLTGGTISSNSNIILDPSGIGDDTGTVIIKGDLNVLGAQTTITSQTLEVSDNIITINKGNTNNDDAGIEIDINSNNNQRLIWSNSDEKWKFIEENTNNLQNIEVSNINLNQLNINNHNENGNNLTVTINNNSAIFDIVGGNSIFNQNVTFNGSLTVSGDSVSSTQTIGGGHIFNTIIGYNNLEQLNTKKAAFSNILVRDESTFQNNIIINGNKKLRFTDVEGNSETPLLSGNFLSLDVSKNLIVHEDVSINGRLDVQGDASFNSNVDVSGELFVENDASFNSNVDIYGNLKTDNIEELNDNSGVTINNTLIIENNVIPIWQQLGQDIDGEAAHDYSGRSVSLSRNGTILAIGAILNSNNAGHVRVYQLNNTSWVQLGVDIDGEASGDYSGISVSLNDEGTRLAIGARGNISNAGHVRVYEYNSNTSSWEKLGQNIDGEAAGDYSGHSVSLNGEGTILAIGAYKNSNNAGHVRVYEYENDTSWVQLGENIDGEAPGDESGYSVSLNGEGNILAIGARYNNNANGDYAGHVRVYEWNDASWVQLGENIDGEAEHDYSGRSVSLNDEGYRLAIGARYNDGNGNSSGHVRVYEWNDTSWVQLGQDIDGEAEDDHSGYSVSLNGEGNILAIGAIYNDGNENSAGHVRVYKLNDTDTSWVQLGVDIDGEAAGDESGISVSLNDEGNILAIGAHYNDNANGENAGHVRVYAYDTLPILPGVLIRSIGEEYDNTLNNRCRLEVNGEFKVEGSFTANTTFVNVHKNMNCFQFVHCLSSGTSLTVYGNFLCYNTVTANAYGYLSDDRLKFNETPITHALDVVRQLNPLNYDQARVKASYDDSQEIEYDVTNTKKSSGFIAQEVYEIDALKHAAIQGDDKMGTWSLSYNDIFTHAVASIKELDKIVQTQQQTIEALQARVAALEA